jgi:hypothetical protein
MICIAQPKRPRAVRHGGAGRCAAIVRGHRRWRGSGTASVKPRAAHLAAGTRTRPLRRVAPCFFMWRTSAPTDAPGCATAQPGASAAQRNQRASAALTASARRAHRQRTRGPSPRARLLGADRTGWNAQRGWITCKCGNSRWQEWLDREPVGDNAAKVTGPMRRVLAQVTGWPTSVQRLEPAAMPAAPAGARCPIRTHIRRPTRLPLLYFPAVLTVRTVRISPLTSGVSAIMKLSSEGRAAIT